MGDFFIAKVFDAIIEISKKKGLEFLKNSFQFNKLIKDLGFSAYIEDTYASNYIRTLLILEDAQDYKEFIPLLREKKVYESFILADKKGDREIFNRELNDQLHINPNLRSLKKYDSVPALLISEFFLTFNKCIEDTWTPNDVLLHKGLIKIDNNADIRHNEIKSEINKVTKILISQGNEKATYSEKISKLTQGRIDSIFEDIKKGNVDTGLENLQKLKNEIWEDIDNDLKNSLIKKIAYCYLEKKDLEHSIQFYEEALSIKKDAGTFSILAVLYHRNADNLKLEKCLKDFDEFAPQKSELTKLRFGTSLQKPDEYYNSVINKHVKDEETLISLLQYFSELKDYKKAFEVGCILIEIYDKAEYKEYVSELGVLYLQTRGINVGINYIDSDDRILFQKGSEFAISCCDYYTGTEVIRYKANILNYRSIYEAWNGHYDLAYHYINQAILIEPENYLFKKTLGSIYSKQKKYTKVIELFERIPNDPHTEDLPLMISVCYFALGKVKEAIIVLETNLEWINNSDIKERTLVQLVDYYFFSNEIKEVEKIFNEYPNSFSFKNKRLIKAKLLNSQGRVEEAKILLIELKNDIINSSELSPIIIDLGMELEKIGELELVIELYEHHSNYYEETFFTKSLYDLYVKTGRLSKVVEICEAQRVKEVHKFYTRNEIAIFYDYKDYDRVIMLGEKYLDNFPDNIEIRLHLIFSLLKRDKKALAKEYLKYSFNVIKLDERNARNLIDLYLKLNLIEEAFETAYKLLAYNNQDVSFNDLYMLVSFHSDKFMESIDQKQIVSDTTVIINENDKTKVLTFTNGETPDYQQKFYNEVRVEDSKYQHLFGRKIGDIVTFIYQNEEYKIEIKEIKHRYIYAFHKALQRCGTSFKEVSAFKMLDASPLKKGQLPDFIKNHLLETEKANASFEDFLNLHEAGRIPLVSIACTFNRQIIDIWEYCTSSINHFIRSSSGNQNDFEEIITYLESVEKDELLIDITSLLLIRKIGGLDNLTKYFSVYVLQDTIDYLEEYIALNSVGADNESSTMNQKDGKNYLITNSATEKKERILQIESFKNWIKANFNIQPPDILLKVDNQKLREYIDLFGLVSAKSCLISGNSNMIFLCDDLAMRDLFFNEFKKPAIWTQSIFNFLKHKEYITAKEYHDISQKLVETNIFYTHINSFIVFDMFASNNFDINNKSLKFLNILRGKTSDNSAFIVAFDLLKMVWSNQDVEIKKKRRITYEVLYSLFISRCNFDVYQYIKLLTNVTFEDFNIRLEIRMQLIELSKIITIFSSRRGAKKL